jgi:hypothetical protein
MPPQFQFLPFLLTLSLKSTPLGAPPTGLRICDYDDVSDAAGFAPENSNICILAEPPW